MTDEHEMRVTRDGRPAAEAEVAAALRAFDPEARVRLAAETGVLHVLSGRDTLLLIGALSKAGFEVGAATG